MFRLQFAVCFLLTHNLSYGTKIKCSSFWKLKSFSVIAEKKPKRGLRVMAPFAWMKTFAKSFKWTQMTRHHKYFSPKSKDKKDVCTIKHTSACRLYLVMRLWGFIVRVWQLVFTLSERLDTVWPAYLS
jgi:hypothetical protein